MTVSIYRASIPVFLRGLDVLSVLLDRAAAHAEARNFDVGILLGARLAPDMLPFTRQFQRASDTAKFAAGRLTDLPAPRFADGEVMARARYLSLDPYMRGRMNAAKSYSKPVEIGEPMEGETVAEVVESRHPNYRPGDLVQARTGWRTYAAISVEGLRRVDPV